MFCGVAHITRQADGWELHCSSFSGRKPILKLAGRSLHPIHHLLILWNGRKSRSLISILPVKVDKAPEASVDTSSTDLIICPQSIYHILDLYSSFSFYPCFSEDIWPNSQPATNRLHILHFFFVLCLYVMWFRFVFMFKVSFSAFVALRKHGLCYYKVLKTSRKKTVFKLIHPFSDSSLSGSLGCRSLTWPLVGKGSVNPGQSHTHAHSHLHLWTI